MEPPIFGIRFIHNAIKKGVLEVEAAAESLSSASDAATLAKRVRFLDHEVHLHTSGEEAGIYPLLEERAQNMGMHYLFDHVEERALFKSVLHLLEDWSPTPAFSRELRSAAASLRYHALLHVKKEEQVVVPVVTKLFNDEEQRTMIRKAVSGYSPDELMQTFPWIVSAQTPEDRVTFIVDDLMKLMPPDVFTAVKGWIQAGIPAAEWADILRRAPQLG
jgi:hemerythrin-like domain-containing protein